MIIALKDMQESVFEKFKGGEGALNAKMFNDDLNRIIYGRLEPGSSIGFHVHDTSSEIIYILQGKGVVLLEQGEEPVEAGICHYCPKGMGHSLVNNSDADLVFFAVVPQQ